MTDIRLERRVGAPRNWVVHAWSDPDLLAEWFCPNPSTSVRAELDVNPNGFWKVAMGAAVVRGEYVEVKLPEVLSFNWQWEHEPHIPPTTVRVTFVALAENSTEVQLEHLDFVDDAEAQSHLEGWNLTLDRLAHVVPSRMAGMSELT